MADQPNTRGIVQVLFTKALTELSEHPIAALSGLVTIIIGIVAFTRTGRSLFKKAIEWLAEKSKPTVPTQTLRIVPSPHERWWHLGKSNDEPAMQVVTKLHVTNITNKPVKILSTVIKPTKTVGHVIVRHPENNIYGGYPILPGATSVAHVDYWIQPPTRKVDEDLKATVILIDQYGNKHKAKNIVFISDAKKRRKKEEPKVPEENIHSITDPIEKEVVSVLKDELNRYKTCGRRVGGLGSVHTVLEGRTYSGVPTDWRKPDSHKQQDIFINQNKVSIESDNLNAMERLFKQVDSDEHRAKIVDALLRRMSRDTEYAPIGYFIMLVLFKNGFLHRTLQVAKTNLQGDLKYGFSDLLRLIDGMLRFKHPNFSSNDLDEIEKFLDGITEHTFRIKERISAIRSYRLSTE